MMKKFFYTLLAFSFFINSTSVQAREINPLDIGAYDQNPIINNKVISLFKTFADNNKAFEELQNLYREELDFLSTEYKLPVFSPEIVDDYSVACSNESLKYSNQERFVDLSGYLDAYLFKYENEDIIDLCEKFYLTDDTDYLFQIDLRTPSFSEKVYERPSLLDWRTFYVDDAVAYAKKYAESPNTGYKYFGDDKDCTNFASQIIIAGGIPITFTGDEQTGWWPYSMTWIQAHRFANWYGIWNKSRNHVWFAEQVSRGDFVALDDNSNGKWDHIGFCVDKDDYVGNYTDSSGYKWSYYDYRIAQHSPHYDKWASWPDNHWEETYRNMSTYGIILTPH